MNDSSNELYAGTPDDVDEERKEQIRREMEAREREMQNLKLYSKNRLKKPRRLNQKLRLLLQSSLPNNHKQLKKRHKKKKISMV